MFVHTVIMVIEPHMKQGRQHKLISTIFLATSVTKKLDHNIEIQNMQAHSVPLDDSDGHDYQHDYEADNCISLVDLENSLKSKLPIERKILSLLIQGYSDKEIAARLGYTKQYINRIKKRIWNMDSPR